MREIKFRGKRVDNGEWVYGDLLHHDNRVGMHNQLNDGTMSVSDVNTDTVGQFTGLLDKNGKEIFEGDVVECVSWNEYFSKDGRSIEQLRRKMIIVFHNGAFQMKEDLPIPFTSNYWGIIYDGDIEIIGNIYENPELLKEATL